jgi:hypothetical protein
MTYGEGLFVSLAERCVLVSLKGDLRGGRPVMSRSRGIKGKSTWSRQAKERRVKG